MCHSQYYYNNIIASNGSTWTINNNDGTINLQRKALPPRSLVIPAGVLTPLHQQAPPPHKLWWIHLKNYGAGLATNKVIG